MSKLVEKCWDSKSFSWVFGAAALIAVVWIGWGWDVRGTLNSLSWWIQTGYWRTVVHGICAGIIITFVIACLRILRRNRGK